MAETDDHSMVVTLPVVVDGDPERFKSSDGRRLLDEFLADFTQTEDEPRCFRQFVALKDYDRFTNQGAWYGLGMGPRHGSIVAAVRLAEPVRRRDPRRITEEERALGVAYLGQLFGLEGVNGERRFWRVDLHEVATLTTTEHVLAYSPAEAEALIAGRLKPWTIGDKRLVPERTYAVTRVGTTADPAL